MQEKNAKVNPGLHPIRRPCGRSRGADHSPCFMGPVFSTFLDDGRGQGKSLEERRTTRVGLCKKGEGPSPYDAVLNEMVGRGLIEADAVQFDTSPFWRDPGGNGLNGR